MVKSESMYHPHIAESVSLHPQYEVEEDENEDRFDSSDLADDE